VLEVRNNAIKVFLPSLGYEMIAEIKTTNIEVVQSGNNNRRSQGMDK
jgi:hypothetical protein